MDNNYYDEIFALIDSLTEDELKIILKAEVLDDYYLALRIKELKKHHSELAYGTTRRIDRDILAAVNNLDDLFYLDSLIDTCLEELKEMAEFINNNGDLDLAIYIISYILENVALYSKELYNGGIYMVVDEAIAMLSNIYSKTKNIKALKGIINAIINDKAIDIREKHIYKYINEGNMEDILELIKAKAKYFPRSIKKIKDLGGIA